MVFTVTIAAGGLFGMNGLILSAPLAPCAGATGGRAERAAAAVLVEDVREGG
ncbi:hypothetical protein [Capillimicrobium parvum]|uniref:Uncharacterized protein n=1 Tax=Capillimicrobium parvum TaxID=2884022 RepID=A0A9E6Y1T7_9ACTN|nr:hypothetical protein [Capillimicrobium parvum]UGS38093.1 hypothetical protein DSM104329_04515 [Capillimicrobium parvum]